MARGNLPAQTPQVPDLLFLPFDLVYRYLLEFNKDVAALEGQLLVSSEVKTSDITKTAVTVFNLELPAYRQVRLDLTMFVSANTVVELVGPAAPTFVHLESQVSTTAAIATSFSSAAAYPAGVAATNAGLIRLRGLVQNGANAGTLQVTWAQAASNATPSLLYAGSVARYSPIA